MIKSSKSSLSSILVQQVFILDCMACFFIQVLTDVNVFSFWSVVYFCFLFSVNKPLVAIWVDVIDVEEKRKATSRISRPLLERRLIKSADTMKD